MNDEAAGAAKRRASFARAERVKKEAAKTPEQRKADADLKAEQKLEAAKAREARKLEQEQKAETLKTEFARKAEQKIEAEKSREARKAEQERKTDAIKTANERKDAIKKQFNKETDAKKAESTKIEAKKIEQAKQVDENRRSRAETFVIERQKIQQSNAIFDQRRQTDQLRTQHREEMKSYKQNEADAITQHWSKIRGIDNAEAKALQELGQQRRSVAGRITEAFRGSQYFEEKRESIERKFESDRLRKHIELEGLKERQHDIAQAARLRQAHERKSIYERHLVERRELVQAQDKARPAIIDRQQQAFKKANEKTITNEKEHKSDIERNYKMAL